jgi:hypothetical protein
MAQGIWRPRFRPGKQKKDLEREIVRLKRLVTDLQLENPALNDVASRILCSPNGAGRSLSVFGRSINSRRAMTAGLLVSHSESNATAPLSALTKTPKHRPLSRWHRSTIGTAIFGLSPGRHQSPRTCRTQPRTSALNGLGQTNCS